MKKYFYYVFEYKNNFFPIKNYVGSGVCESSENGLFPLYRAVNDCLFKIKSDPENDHREDYTETSAIRITNIAEISKEDFLMFNYEEICGKDEEK